MKIAIIGVPGSGKSTLAFKLHKILHIPLFHLDQYFWQPGWQRPDREESTIARQLHAGVARERTSADGRGDAGIGDREVLLEVIAVALEPLADVFEDLVLRPAVLRKVGLGNRRDVGVARG